MTFEAHVFFKVLQFLCRFWKWKKNQGKPKIFFDFEIIAFELVALKTRFY